MKIYNKIIIEWNDKTQSYDKVVYEDSYEYDGELMMAETSSCPDATTNDGHDHGWIIIGDQCWLSSNLETTVYNNGDTIDDCDALGCDWPNAAIPYRVDNTEYAWGGYYYNWYAVDDVRGICPTDWHVSSHDEWTELERYLCMTDGYQNQNICNL